MEIKDMDFKAIETRKEITAMLDDKDLDIRRIRQRSRCFRTTQIRH